MKFLTIMFFIITNSAFAQSFSSSLIGVKNSETLSAGLNPVTNELLPNSDWDIKYSTVNVGDCSEVYSTGHVFNNGTKEFVETNYKPSNSLNCSGLTVSNDPNNLAPWSDLGIVQELNFSDETLTCGITNACDINMNTSTQDLFLSVINPTNGENATLAGKTNLILYNFKELNITSQNGSRGIGGLADLPNYISKVKYCVKLKDATNQTRTSTYAKNPELSVLKYNWTPIKQGDHGLNGFNVTPGSNKNIIFKGVDSSTRYLLGLKGVLND